MLNIARMKCINKNCQKEIPEDSQFCYSCGTKQPERKKCSKCKCKNIASDAFFCPECGERLDASQKTEFEILESKLKDKDDLIEKLQNIRESIKCELEGCQKELANESYRRFSLENELVLKTNELLEWEAQRDKLNRGLALLKMEKADFDKKSVELDHAQKTFISDRDCFIKERDTIKSELENAKWYRRSLEVQLQECRERRRRKEKKISTFKNIIKGIVAYVVVLFLVLLSLALLRYYNAFEGNDDDVLAFLGVASLVFLITYFIPKSRRFMIWIGGTSFIQFSLSIMPGILLVLFDTFSVCDEFLIFPVSFCAGTVIHWLLSFLQEDAYGNFKIKLRHFCQELADECDDIQRELRDFLRLSPSRKNEKMCKSNDHLPIEHEFDITRNSIDDKGQSMK